MVRDASAYNFPSEWGMPDWLNVAMSLAGAYLGDGNAAPWGDHARRRRFLQVSVAVGIAGILGTALGAELPYALLFQGQPYRALWILKALQVPLGFWLIRRWACTAELPRRIAALGLLF